MSFVSFYQGDRSISRIPLVGRPVHLGASPAMDFTLPDKSLPASWCRLEPIGLLDYHLRTDLPEGVLIDGVAKTNARLYGGETVQVSDFKMVFHRAPLDEADFKPVSAVPQSRCTGTLQINEDGKSLKANTLVLRTRGATEQTVYAIKASGLRIGASTDNDLVLKDQYCSGLHAFVFWENQRLFIQDLESTNGTFVNNVSIQKTELKKDFVIQLGETIVEVLDQEETVSVPELQGEGPWQLGRLKTNDFNLRKHSSWFKKSLAMKPPYVSLGKVEQEKNWWRRAYTIAAPVLRDHLSP